jgi:hypothetical protein
MALILHSNKVYLTGEGCAMNEFPYSSELSAFIQDNCDSIEKWDILVYFSRLANAKETISSLIGLTGKSQQSIQRAVDDLSASGILLARPSNNGKPTQYSIIPDRRPLLEKLRQGLENRQYRFKLMMLALENVRNRNMVLHGGAAQ